MRRISNLLLGVAIGSGLTVLAIQPPSALVAAARAAASTDTYSQLNLFGEVFERVRADYVEKPSDSALMEGAINGMVTSLDPHSRYMNDKAWHEMQETTSPRAMNALVTDTAWSSRPPGLLRRSTT